MCNLSPKILIQLKSNSDCPVSSEFDQNYILNANVSIPLNLH